MLKGYAYTTWLSATVFSAVLTVTPLASADTIYRYVDASGVIHFSNAPTDARFRAFRSDRTRYRVVPAVPSTALHRTIDVMSLQHRMDPALIRAVIKAESAFDSAAVSPKGAMGLMQLMPDTAWSLQVSNPYDPEQNISGGVRHLRYLLDRFHGDIPLALAAYNAGEAKARKDTRIPETREYVRRVLRLYQDFLKEDGKREPTGLNVETAALITPHY